MQLKFEIMWKRIKMIQKADSSGFMSLELARI
jgi:hypothetical protein